MAEYSKDQVISSLKDMQSEITAIRYYNSKLASMKKQISSSSIDQSAYDTTKASRLMREKDRALASQKEPTAKKSVLDIILFVPFAVFSFILMIMLFPGDKMPLLFTIVNWIFLGYSVAFPVFLAARASTGLGKVYDSIPKGGKYALWGVLGVSVIAYVIDGILRPIFFIVACPILLGFLMLLAKGKENKRLAASAQSDAQLRIRTKYDKLIADAHRDDEAEKARLQADLEAEQAAKQRKHAPVIDECTKALAKHKTKFNEVNILPAEILKKDSGVVDSLLKALEGGDAETLEDAIAVWKKTLLEREADFGEIYVSVALRRREGWSPIRNMIYVDNSKVGTAESPYRIIKVVPGSHAISAKVQLNYGGASHYPQSEPVEFSVAAGEKKYVKFFVSGAPTVQYRVCRDMNEFSAEI